MLALNSQVYTSLYLCLLSVEIKVVPTTTWLKMRNYSNKELIRYCQGPESEEGAGNNANAEHHEVLGGNRTALCYKHSGGYNTVKVSTKNKLTTYSLKGIFRKCSLNFLSENIHMNKSSSKMDPSTNSMCYLKRHANTVGLIQSLSYLKALPLHTW